MDELSLALDAQKGDLDAFNRLVLAYQDMVFNLACRLLNDDNLAADATQNAFLSAYRNISSYRGGSFRAWLMRIVTNTCYDELRRIKRHPNIPLEPVNEEDGEEIESPAWMADDDPTPEQALEQKEIERAIQHCLEGLPPEFRVVAIMVDVEGLDYEEVSTVIHAPLGTIKSRLARARFKMRDCLSRYRELLPSFFRPSDEDTL
jgi:RNA polymerase sigma-70 factor (ECF subfamily)